MKIVIPSINWSDVKRNVLHAIALQSVVTLGTLPILIHAGLPLALLGFIGNIVFVPFLTFFIFLSFLVFLGFLFHVCLWPLIWALDVLVDIWTRLLSLGTWWGPLIYFPAHPWLSQLVCWAALVPLLHLRILRKNDVHWVSACFGVLVLSCLILKYAVTPVGQAEYVDRKQTLKCLVTDQGIIVDDYAALRRISSLDSFVFFTLKPFLSRTFGSINIVEYRVHARRQSLSTEKYAAALRAYPFIHKAMCVYDIKV